MIYTPFSTPSSPCVLLQGINKSKHQCSMHLTYYQQQLQKKKTAEVYQQIFSAESFSSSAVHTCVFCRKPTNMHSYDPKILATEQIKLSETIQIIGCRDVNCNILVISLLKEPKYWGISI
jgi:hypothetical protein